MDTNERTKGKNRKNVENGQDLPRSQDPRSMKFKIHGKWKQTSVTLSEQQILRAKIQISISPPRVFRRTGVKVLRFYFYTFHKTDFHGIDEQLKGSVWTYLYGCLADRNKG